MPSTFVLFKHCRRQRELVLNGHVGASRAFIVAAVFDALDAISHLPLLANALGTAWLDAHARVLAPLLSVSPREALVLSVSNAAVATVAAPCKINGDCPGAVTSKSP